MGKFLGGGGLLGSVFSALDTPSAPKVASPPPAPPPNPAPPPVDISKLPATPDQNSQDAQAAAVQAKAEADQRRRRSTFLTGPGGINADKFSNPGDIAKASLFGSGR